MATAAIDQKRFAKVQKRGLDSGAHSKASDGMCAMSAVELVKRMCALSAEQMAA